jgi:hypothetical protein
MALLGMLMMGSMVLGGTAGAVIDSTKGVSDACDQWTQAQSDFNDLKSKWAKLNQGDAQIIQELKSVAAKMNTQTSALTKCTKMYHDMAKKRQFVFDAGIAAFIISIVIMLILKRSNFYSTVYHLISGDKK